MRNKNKISLKYLEDLEENGNKEDIEKLNELLNEQISEADLTCLCHFLYRTADKIFIDNSYKKNSLEIFELIYKKYIKDIIENIGNSKEKFLLVDYIIKATVDAMDYVGVREELFDIITYPFDSLNFNELLLKNVDFNRIRTDEEYARNIEKIFFLFEEYNYNTRHFDDDELQEDRKVGISAICKYITARRNSNSRFYIDSSLMDYLLLHASESYARGEQVDSSIYPLIKECIAARTRQKNVNAFNDHGLSDLLQIIYSDKRKLYQVSELKKIIEDNLHVKNIDRKQAYLNAKAIIQKEGLTERNLERLFIEIQKVKLTSKGIIPDDILEFLVAELLKDDSVLNRDPNKYREYISRIYESLGTNQLSEKVKKKKSHFYFTRDYLDIIDSEGTQTGNTIYLLTEKFPDALETINTIFHENTHLEQDYNINRGDCSYEEYMALKENILCDRLPGYQTCNYDYLFIEMHARKEALIKMLRYFLKSDVIRNSIDKKKIEKIKDEFKREISEFVEAFKKREKENSDEEKNVNDIFLKYVNRAMIRKYPILSFEYNKNRTLKSLKQIVEEIEITKNQRKRTLLTKIIKNNGIIREDTIYDDANYLMNYSSNSIIDEKIVSQIVSGTFMKVLYEQYKKYDKLDPETQRLFVDTIKKMKNKFSEEPESAFSKGLKLKSNNGVAVIETFNLMLRALSIQCQERVIEIEGDQKQ